MARTEVDKLEAVAAQLTALPNLMRQSLADQRWAELDTYVRETVFLPAAPIGSAVNLSPSSSSPYVVQCVVVSLPAGASGTLTLADVVVPLPAGLTVIPDLRMVLAPSDARQILTAGAAGAVSFTITGNKLPLAGKL